MEGRGLFSRLDVAEESTSELEGNTRILQNWKAKRTKAETKNRRTKDRRAAAKGETHA